MASRRWGDLTSTAMILAGWLPACAFTILHYATAGEHHWFHDILRRLYYLPIIFAAFSCGVRGGLVLAVLIALAYTPHAFTHLTHQDPAVTLEKALEILLYLVVGGVSGVLVDRQRREETKLAATAEQLRIALAEEQRTAEQLVRAGRLAALGEMVAGIAHEIKNPLHALRGTAEVVDPVVPREIPQRKMWELHLREIDRLDEVAGRFLSFARPSPLEMREVDLLTVVDRTRALIEAQAGQQAVAVVLEAAVGRPTAVADEQQLIQVLLNISLNAVQAMAGQGGELRFAVGSRRQGAREFQAISLTNSGPPIPEEDRERIFNPFFTRRVGNEGVGLGLAIAARIVEQHGGHIEVRNLPAGKGVEFAVLLPRDGAPEA